MRDHRLDHAPQLLRLGQRGVDLLVRQQRVPPCCGTWRAGGCVVRFSFRESVTVTHGAFLSASLSVVPSPAGGQFSSFIPRVSPREASTSLISLSDLRPRFGRLQQLGLGALDQVADVVDVLGLQAVGRAHRELQVVHRAQQDRIDRRPPSSLGRQARCLRAARTPTAGRPGCGPRSASPLPARSRRWSRCRAISLSRSVRCSTRADSTA